MVKLRYIKEDQLELFSWKPKEIEQPREQSTYDGLSDTDQNSWYNTTFFKKKKVPLEFDLTEETSNGNTTVSP